MELFSKVVADDGTESFVQVEQLPEEIVKAHSEFQRVDTLYKKAVDESKKFKQRAQEAEAKLQPSEEKEPQEKDLPQAKVEPINEEELSKRLYEKIKAEFATENQAKQTANLEVENLIKQHRLQGVEGIREILAGAGSGKTTLAENLGRSLKAFTPIDGGEVDVDSPDFMKGVYERLNLPK
jgi:hypothetical protein